MSEDSAGPRRYSDTVVIPAVLVRPGDPPPPWPDTVRIPVRIVMRSPDVEVGSPDGVRDASPAAVRRETRPEGGRIGGDNPEIAQEPLKGRQRGLPVRFPPGDPIGSFLRANDALDRLMGGGGTEAPATPAGRGAAPGIEDPTAPVPVVDDMGVRIDGARGPMMRPAGLPPELFIKQGLADRRIFEEQLAIGGLPGMEAALAHEWELLEKFRQGGEWDAQRVGHRYHDEYVDYATVAIGLYAAAAGIPEAAILTIQDTYAFLRSRYRDKAGHDKDYPSLLHENVENTQIGYSLYRSQRMKAHGTE